MSLDTGPARSCISTTMANQKPKNMRKDVCRPTLSHCLSDKIVQSICFSLTVGLFVSCMTVN